MVCVTQHSVLQCGQFGQHVFLHHASLWLIAFSFFAIPSFANETYVFVDAQGVAHYTNNPNGDRRYKKVTITPAQPCPPNKICSSIDKQGVKHYFSMSPVKAQTQAKPASVLSPTASDIACQVKDIYFFKDSAGVIHFTTDPGNDKRYVLFRKSTQGHRSQYGSCVPDKFYYGRSQSTDTIVTTKRRLRPSSTSEARRRLYAPHIERIASQYGLDPHLMYAVISAESSFNPNAVSPAGAMGLMQLMPDTAKRFGVADPFDPVSNLEGGAKYLRFLLRHFQGDWELALAGYNAGEGAVKRHGNAIPPYQETITYVDRVLRFYNHYRQAN